MVSVLRGLLAVWWVVMLSACGSGGSGGGGSAEAPDANALVRSLQLLVSSPQLPSSQGTDGEAESVTLTAIAKNEENNLLQGVDVRFAADGGNLQVMRSTTDASGTAEALLTTVGNPTNRAITVSASAGTGGGVTDTNAVAVVGTRIDITGVRSTVLGEAVNLTINVTDSEGMGIPNASLEITSDQNNPLVVSRSSTDNNGQLSVQVLAEVGGTDNIRVRAVGTEAVFTLFVNTASFALEAVSGEETTLNTDTVIRLEWRDEGMIPPEQVGRIVNLSTTRGQFVESGTSSVSLVTEAGVNEAGQAAGVAEARLRANNAGPAVISATTRDGTTVSTQIDHEFVATVPASIVAQANPSQIGAGGEQSTITVTVRDANNNPVKNAEVTFDLEDVTGGTISTGIDVTDSQGTAQTIYTSNTAVSGADSVRIRATVSDDPSVQTTIGLTVARAELFIKLGTGDELIELDDTRYALPYSVLVTDVEGNGVQGATVDLQAIPEFYYKGFYVVALDQEGELVWVPIRTTGPCINEDLNRNGLLDPGEDDAGTGNDSGTLEPGNVISVVSPQSTDADGFALFQMPYAQQFANWVDVRLEARGAVAGSEAASRELVTLPINALELLDTDSVPPGVTSPFGVSGDCTCSIEDELPPVRAGCERVVSTLDSAVEMVLEPSTVRSPAQVLLTLTRDNAPFPGVDVTGVITGQPELLDAELTDLECVTDAAGMCLLHIEVLPEERVSDSARIVYHAAGQEAVLSVLPEQLPPALLTAQPSSLAETGVVLLELTRDGEPLVDVEIEGIKTGQTGLIGTTTDLSCTTDASGRCTVRVGVVPGEGLATLVYVAEGASVNVTVTSEPEPPPAPVVETLTLTPASLGSNGRVLISYSLDDVPANNVTITGVVSGSTSVIDETASDMQCVTGQATADATPGRGQCLNDIELQPGAPSGATATITWAVGTQSVQLVVTAP